MRRGQGPRNSRELGLVASVSAVLPDHGGAGGGGGAGFTTSAQLVSGKLRSQGPPQPARRQDFPRFSA